MNNYIKYLIKNPVKIIAILFVIGVGSAANGFVNTTSFNLWLSIGIALFTTLITCLILLQVWGEYKKIEGFWPAVKAYFKWK